MSDVQIPPALFPLNRNGFGTATVFSAIALPSRFLPGMPAPP
jgi:hypothetical protein